MISLGFNATAATSQRLLGRSDGIFQQSVQRLSSGLRVNSAADDASGLALSEKMRNQVRGLHQAAKNAQDGISMIQAAEGALGVVHSMLARLRELAVQSANGVYTDTDRTMLQSETNELVAEITRVAESASFNGGGILGGGTGHSPEDLVADGLRAVWLRNAEDRIAQYYGIQGDDKSTFTLIMDDDGGSAPNNPAYCTTNATGIEMHINMDFWTDGTIDGVVDTSADNPNLTLPHGGQNVAPFYLDLVVTHELTHGVMFTTLKAAGVTSDNWWMEGTAEFSHGADDRVKGDAAVAGSVGALIAGSWDTWAGGGTSAEYSGAYLAVKYLETQLLAAGKDIKDVINDLKPATSDMDTALTNNIGMTEAAFIADFKANGAAWAATNLNLTNTDTGSIAGSDYGHDVLDPKAAAADIPAPANDPLQHYREINWPAGFVHLQVGANNVAHADSLDLTDVTATAVGYGLQGLSLSTASDALAAIDTIDRAVDAVSDYRTALGAVQNRLEYTLTSIGVGAENQGAAESRIRDADVAVTTSNLVRSQLIKQIGTAMLAQANIQPRGALALLPH